LKVNIENNFFILKNANLRFSSRFINIISYKDTPRLFNLINPELLRFNAFFYGFYYDIKDANYNLWLTVGLKKNINVLFPLFYFILNSAKLFNKIQFKNWILLNYLIKDSFININILENKYNIYNTNLTYNNCLKYNLQYSDDLINLTYTLGMHSVININSFSGLDYSISSNYGFWYYNNLVGVADRLFLQYSFIITANENTQIVSPYLFLKFFYFVKFFRYCFIFIINNVLWNNQKYSSFYLILLKVFKNYLINIIIFNYNRFFFFNNKFNIYIKFFYYLIKKPIIIINFFNYKGFLKFKYANIFALFKIFKYNINNYISTFNYFISFISEKIVKNKNKLKKKLKFKINFNFFSKLFYKLSSNLKLSLICLNKYLDMLFFFLFKNLSLEDILLKYKLKKAFEGNNKNYFLIMKEWIYFFFKKYLLYQNKVNIIGSINFNKKLIYNNFNNILNSFSKKKYLFSIYFNRFFVSRFYGFFYWNENYKYRVDRKYHSIFYFSSAPKIINFVWFDLIVYSKIKLLINTIFFKFIFLILRKNLAINISIFSSFFIIINLLFSYFAFSKLYFNEKFNKCKTNIIFLFNFLFLNRYLIIGKKFIKKKFLNYFIIKGYNKIIEQKIFFNKI
jgi:hypothetical protein